MALFFNIPNERLCFCLSVVKPLDYKGYAIDAEFLLSQYTLLKHDETILSVTIMHAAALLGVSMISEIDSLLSIW